MYIQKVKLQNFRSFGDEGICFLFNKGINAVIGENNNGKTALIDAIRIAFSCVLYKKDIFFSKTDFHVNAAGERAAFAQIDVYLKDVPQNLIEIWDLPLCPRGCADANHKDHSFTHGANAAAAGSLSVRIYVMKEILTAWQWDGPVSEPVPYGEGHINQTYAITVTSEQGAKRYILQKINTNIFKDPAGLMENVCGVTDFLREKAKQRGADPARATLHVVPTKEEKPYYQAADGSCWRVYEFVENTVCLQQVQSAEDFYQSAVAFGNFQHQLADYPAHTLHETIPHFHDTPKRFADFQRAVVEDRMGRVAQVQREIEFVRAREADYHVMVDLLAAGKLPLRVTHNDTKLNNILFDKTTGEGLCVIDLDTVMPGLAANDFGDSIRFGANHCAEDEADLSKVNFSMELFEIYTKGFLQAAGEAFTPLEKQTLPWGAKLMTMECGMRFLADYLEGDHYFHINYETQNLNRARTQFKLTADMERNWDAMQKVIEKYC